LAVRPEARVPFAEEEAPMHLADARGLKRELLETLILDIRLGMRPSGLAAQRLEAARAIHRTLALGVAPGGQVGYRVAVRIQRREVSHETIETIRRRAAGEIDVRYVGRIVKAAAIAPDWTRARIRPMRIGLSVGHHAITAGTLGGFLRPATEEPNDSSALYLLSNNHVLADENRAQVGDVILQPGSYDGGVQPDDRVATLESFVPVEPEAVNTVDCAMARVDDDVAVDVARLGDDAVLAGVTDLVESGEDRVTKTGRTTGLTEGRVTAFELDNVVVGYDRGNLRFDNQLEIESATDAPFSQGGDSGSLIVTASDRLAAGLLFAGSDQGGRGDAGLTYANPITAVTDALDAILAVEDDGAVATLDQARAAKARVMELLEGSPELRGVGIARAQGGFCVKVNLVRSPSAPLPADVDGVPVVVEVVGDIRAL
jgi:S1-C subfamily serine protease